MDVHTYQCHLAINKGGQVRLGLSLPSRVASGDTDLSEVTATISPSRFYA